MSIFSLFVSFLPVPACPDAAVPIAAHRSCLALPVPDFLRTGRNADSKLRRYELFRTRLAKLFASTFQDEETFYFADLLKAVNEGLSNDALFGTAEANAAVQLMSEANELMLSEGVVYKI